MQIFLQIFITIVIALAFFVLGIFITGIEQEEAKIYYAGYCTAVLTMTIIKLISML